MQHDECRETLMNFKRELQAHLKAILRRQGVTQSALATMIGVHQSRLSFMLNSDADRVSIDKLIEAIVKLDGVFMVKIGDQTDINRVRYRECEDNV